MHYIIDGYNLMFRVVRAGDDLQATRRLVIETLDDKLSLLNIHATLVFDAHYQPGDSVRNHFGSLEIIFSAENETADQWILHTVKLSSKPSSITVVTSDKKLAWGARMKLAKTLSVEEFLQTVRVRCRNKAKRSREPAREPIPPKISGPAPDSVPAPGSFDYYLEHFERSFNEIKSEPRKKKK